LQRGGKKRKEREKHSFPHLLSFWEKKRKSRMLLAEKKEREKDPHLFFLLDRVKRREGGERMGGGAA